MKTQIYRPTRAEIDLNAIRYNFLQVQKAVDSSVKILVAVKANAYGHGLIDISRLLAKCGVDYFGVGTIDEAITLKRAHIGVPILNLTSITKEEIKPVIDHGITQTVPDIKLARLINRIAEKKRAKVKIHLKIDTGMGRLGVWHNEAVCFIKQVLRLKNLTIEGVFTHFASADENPFFTNAQIANFLTLLKELEGIGINIKFRHAANSAAIINYRSSHFNIIRPGIMIYGLYPNMSLRRKIKLKPALSLKSRISCIKDIPPGRSISYGNTYTTSKDSRIAIVPVGYGDGYNRQLSNKGEVLINRKRVPIVGRICMDQIMVDITGLTKVKEGDEVVLIGAQGKNTITAEEVAVNCGTIPYEVTCWISSRVPRVYKKL